MRYSSAYVLSSTERTNGERTLQVSPRKLAGLSKAAGLSSRSEANRALRVLALAGLAVVTSSAAGTAVELVESARAAAA